MTPITQAMRDRAVARRLAKNFETLVRNNNAAFRIPDEIIDASSDEVLRLMIEMLNNSYWIRQRADGYWERKS